MWNFYFSIGILYSAIWEIQWNSVLAIKMLQSANQTCWHKQHAALVTRIVDCRNFIQYNLGKYVVCGKIMFLVVCVCPSVCLFTGMSPMCRALALALPLYKAPTPAPHPQKRPNLDFTIQGTPSPAHYEARTVGKRLVGTRLDCLLVAMALVGWTKFNGRTGGCRGCAPPSPSKFFNFCAFLGKNCVKW